MTKYICIHGHFYQPPRENPWLEAVELQDSAYPYHDWNQRITAECYAPNTAARILDEAKQITHIVNNYARISFNFGPTLLSWMEEHDPDTYHAIITADRESQRIFTGHGSALMQCYNHMIMPLANRHDKRTQIVWGLRDFESRFERPPEGAWLPETAVDLETLDILAEVGIKFTILAPHQARMVRTPEGHDTDVSGSRIDIRRPYRCRLPSGRDIAIFFYDGPMARDVAFGGLLSRGEDFARRLLDTFSGGPDNPLIHIATDGETYGHHHHRGDMALAFCLNFIERHQTARITNYGRFLADHPPDWEVELFENSSWSCVHGVERWRNNCGCRMGGHGGWTQNWRAPLRAAMDWLRDQLVRIYETEGAKCLSDVWAARDAYIDVVRERSRDSVERFFAQHASRRLADEEKRQCLKLLEMQRHAMLMYTSCGWFFDEISGIETVQILQYAARAMQLAEEIGRYSFEQEFLSLLARAPSNVPYHENGAMIYERLVKPFVLDLVRVGAHYAVSSLFEEYPESTPIYSYTAESQLYDRLELGRHKLAVGKAKIRSDITGQDNVISFAVLHEGGHHLTGGVREYEDERSFARMHQDIKEAFRRNDTQKSRRLIAEHFGTGHYSLRHLFKDEQRKILYQILDSSLVEIERSLRQINEYQHPIIEVVKELQIPLPKVLANTVSVMLNTDLLRVLGSARIDFGRLRELVAGVKEWGLEVDKITLAFLVVRKIEDLMGQFLQSPRHIAHLETVGQILDILQPLSLELDLWKAQNIYFSIGHKMLKDMQRKAGRGHIRAQKWVEHFERLGEYFQVRII